MHKILLTLIALFLSATANAALYKWVDDKGNTHYSDKAPVNQQAEVKTLPVANSYSASEANDGIGAVVEMYSTSWCGYCKKARRYFKANNIAYREYDIEKSASAARRHKQLGGRGVPLIVIGDKTISGFSAEAFEAFYRANQ